MAQFQVYRLPDGTRVLDLQSDLIQTGARVVAPLIAESADLKSITRLEPIFEIEGEPLALHIGEMAAIPAHLLKGKPVADLSQEDYAIRGALSMLFSGF